MLRQIVGDRRGSISILAALSFVAVIGVAALAVEYGNGLLQRSAAQRVADLAAYGGALVYNATGSSDSATGAAANIASLNGLSGAAASVVNSPTGDGNEALQVNVSTSVPLHLARLLTSSTALAVGAAASAEIKVEAPGCIIALGPGGTGLTMNGGTQINAAGCAVASNSTVTLTGGAKITTKDVNYGTSYSVTGGSSIVPPAGTGAVTYAQVTTPDPLSGDSAVAAATGRLSTVSAMTSPTVTGGVGVYFDYNGGGSTTIASLATDGCTGTFVSPVWTVTCGANVTLGELALKGGITVNFVTSGVTYNISKVAPSPYGCTIGYSICNKGNSLTFAGPSTFVLAGGIYNGGGATMSLGSGSTNSYDIGKAGDEYSINIGGGAVTTLGDATGAGDLFQTAGNIANGGSGTACLAIPAAAEHDINGYVSLACGATLGAGVYTVADYVAIGCGSGGGTVTASNVTLVLGGAAVPSSGSCAGLSFYVGAGFNDVTLTAPSSGTMEDLAVIGPTSSSAHPTAGALFTGGTGGTTITGAFYLPNGAVSLSGSGVINNGGGCLELVGSQVTLTGGSAATSTCAGLGGGSSGSTNGTVALVQ